MKGNVDLTSNRDFANFNSPRSFSFIQMFGQYCLPDVIVEHKSNVDLKQLRDREVAEDVYLFTQGKQLVATGDKELRNWKTRAIRYSTEICEECLREIRVPWRGCTCYHDWKAINCRIPWRGSISTISRRMPWVN